MAQSLSKLYVHIIFHIKNTSVTIKKEHSKNLYAYIGSILKSHKSIPIAINGVGDHIHILCVLSKNIALSDLVSKIKSNSSRWIKTVDKCYKTFGWQGGYGGFSVSSSMHDKTVEYIKNQEKHHKKMTFREEYLKFLKEYGVDFDEEHLWVD